MTASRTFKLGPSPQVLMASCKGDLRVQGWDRLELELLSWQADDGIVVEEQESCLQISAHVSLRANVPQLSVLTLQGCSGDVRVSHLEALHVNGHLGDVSGDDVKHVEVSSAYGDVSLSDSDSLVVTGLNGDLSARGLREKASVTQVLGDVSLSGTPATVSVREITGDVVLTGPAGDVDVRQVNGDLKLAGNLQAGHLALEGNGDIVVRLDPQSSVRVQLKAPLGRVRSDVELQHATASPHTLTGQFGAGTAQLDILAQTGSVRIRETPFRECARGVAGEREEAFARRQAEHARRLEEKLRRKAERLEEKARERSERLAQAIESRSAARTTTRASLSEERLTVLRLLSEGKISAAEAEGLLEAMED